MISNKTITIISETLANLKFKEYCNALDEKIEAAMNGAFKDERISTARCQRIVDKFVKGLGVS